MNFSFSINCFYIQFDKLFEYLNIFWVATKSEYDYQQYNVVKRGTRWCTIQFFFPYLPYGSPPSYVFWFCSYLCCCLMIPFLLMFSGPDPIFVFAYCFLFLLMVSVYASVYAFMYTLFKCLLFVSACPIFRLSACPLVRLSACPAPVY